MSIKSDHWIRRMAAAQGMIEAHLLDLIALSLTQATGRSLPRPSRTRSMIRMKVRAEIQARLSDPSTDAEAIASAAGVSLSSIRRAGPARVMNFHFGGHGAAPAPFPREICRFPGHRSGAGRATRPGGAGSRLGRDRTQDSSARIRDRHRE